MRIVCIGAGNLATHLGLALVEQGIEIVQIYSRTLTSAVALARKLSPAGKIGATSTLEEVCTDADLYLFAVKDSALPGLIESLAPARQHAVFLHTAGSIPMSVFEGHLSRYGVFYLMQTFSKQRAVDFRQIPVFLEASDEQLLDHLRSLAEKVSDKIYMATSEQRKYLHLSAVFACNFVNHCYALSARLLKEQGLPFEVMFPLIDETAAKVHDLSPEEAQTGPAVRYDRNVMDKQTELLEAHPQWRLLYEEMSKSIHQISERTDDKL